MGVSSPGDAGRVSADDLPPESWASSAGTRRSMIANRRRDTSPEWKVRRLLHARGLRYRVDLPLPFDKRRRADITFTRAKVVVFIDGCFWHGCPQHYVAPKSHPEYWGPKIEANAARDAQTTRQLEDLGWTVLRFWEHEDPQDVADRIEAVIAQRTAPRQRTATPQPEAEPPQPGELRDAAVGVILWPWRLLRSMRR